MIQKIRVTNVMDCPRCCLKQVSIQKISRLICLALFSTAFCRSALAEDITNAIHACLQQCVENEMPNGCMVVGLMDKSGSRIISYGKLDNGSDQRANGDTVFEIGSITKTFTGLLLQDMVKRGQMNLGDPVANYLPRSVKLPTYHDRQITLLQLATHTSGLPDSPDNLDPKRADNSRADYTFAKLAAFVSGYNLTREPGAEYEYSTVGIALLAQAIALKAGTNYESLVVDRICGPLKMNNTRITLTPELATRFAQGHNFYGYQVSHTDWGSLVGGAALRSTANDLLKYVAANLGLTSSALTPLMKSTHVPRFYARMDTDTDVDTDIGLTWMIMHDSNDTTIIGHGGLTRGFVTFVGFDTVRRRGVVVLCSSLDLDVPRIGRLLLESEWDSDRRPTQARVISRLDDSCVGQYRISPAQAVGPLLRHGIGIYRKEDRLYIRVTGPATWPRHVLTPPVTDELVPESEGVYFERLSGVSITFSRDVHGHVSGFSGHYRDHAFDYDKISDQPPTIPKLSKPSVAITLDAKHLDAFVGSYIFPPKSPFPGGAKMAIWREGHQLECQIRGQDAIEGAFDIDPASQTNFFIKLDGAHFTFIKNNKGEVTAVIHHSAQAGVPDAEGKKITRWSG